MKRIPASGKRSSASMKAEPTIPNTSVTPWDTRVSTKASLPVIRVGSLDTTRASLDLVSWTVPNARDDVERRAGNLWAVLTA